MKRSNLLPIVFGSLLILLLIISSAILFPNSITFRPFGVNEVTQLLTLLALISLFLERALEVFINTWRGPEEERLNNEIQSNERVIADKIRLRQAKIDQPQAIATAKRTAVDGGSKPVAAQVSIEAMLTNTDELTEELHQELENLKEFQNERSRYKSQTRKLALWTALFVGLVVSGVGVRSLDTLVQPVQGSLYSGIQTVMLRCLDVILTGGLIAGGSDGIHKVTQLFTTFFEENRDRLRDKPN